MKRLIPILTYILELPKEILIQTRLYKIELYANFMNQNLADRYEVNGVMAHPLNRFIPCTLDGKIIELPDVQCLKGNGNCQCGEEQVSDCREWKSEYYIAKSRCLFEGFEDSEWNVFLQFPRIEDLIELSPKLTQTAQKLIGVSPN